MLFIDNPVGAGFSYTSNNGYCKDTKGCVARNLYSLLTQFYTVFPEQQKNELWITGESYAGAILAIFLLANHNTIIFFTSMLM
jgi:carboxypeptidase C (cathepsin A)